MQNEVVNVQNSVQASQMSLSDYLNQDIVRKKFIDVLNQGANGFISSLLSLVKSSPQLTKSDPKTVMAAAMTAATLKLPINPNLGLAYIVPYNNKGRMEATFQMGYKGFVQLAERTGQYRTINSTVVYEGQIEDIDFITGEIIRGKKISDKVVGYVAYIEFVNGFRKTLYMTRDEMEAHAKKYSQTYKKGFGVWKDNFDAMAMKTVLKLLISKYGIMSIDMQSSDMARALESDNAVVNDACGEPTYTYVDNMPNPSHEAVQEVSFEDVSSDIQDVKKSNTSESQTNEVSQPAPADDDEPEF